MNALRVKICGVTRVEDAVAAVELGASLIGVNLWPGSPRCVTVERAREIVGAVAGRALVAGVFVDQPPEEVGRARQEAGLALVQLHGEEGPEEVAAHGGAALRVFRVRDAFDGAALDLYPEAWGFLFDCRHETLQGGTGEGWRYEIVAGLASGRRLLVAGGVRPGRVREVVTRARPWGVDVCSGVERAPGVKDHALMRRLFEEIADEQAVALA